LPFWTKPKDCALTRMNHYVMQV